MLCARRRGRSPWSGSWWRPTARSWRPCRIAARGMSPLGYASPPRSSPKCAGSRSPRSSAPPRRTHAEPSGFRLNERGAPSVQLPRRCRSVDRGTACLDARPPPQPSRDLMKKLFAFALAAEKTETMKVSGWHCAGCAAKTEAALKDVKGVTAVAADKNKKEVKVTYDDAKVKRADLEKAIADSGYDVEN